MQPAGRPQGIAPTIHGLSKLIRRIVGAIPCGRPFQALLARVQTWFGRSTGVLSSARGTMPRKRHDFSGAQFYTFPAKKWRGCRQERTHGINAWETPTGTNLLRKHETF